MKLNLKSILCRSEIMSDNLYFCIIRHPCTCRGVIEYTFFEYSSSKDWNRILDRNAYRALDESERLKLHSNVKMSKDFVETIKTFGDDDAGYVAYIANLHYTGHTEAWMSCEKCILNAERKGVPLQLICCCND